MAASATGLGTGVGRTAGVLADEASGAHDAVVGLAVDDEVLDDGEGSGAEGLDGDGLAIGEGAHVDLAGGAAVGALGNAVDDDAAGAADALAAVALEGDGGLPSGGEPVIDDVEHLEEGTVGGDVARVDILEAACGLVGILSPESEMEVHGRDYL